RRCRRRRRHSRCVARPPAAGAGLLPRARPLYARGERVQGLGPLRGPGLGPLIARMAEDPTAPEGSHLDPAARRIGSVLDGKWALDSVLGVGGMAAVYANTHRNGARAAIKLFPFSVTTSVEFAERILREGYLANKIGHPSVVRVLDDHLDRQREYAYLVM